MAEVTAQPGGGAQVTVTAVETAGLKGLAADHLTVIQRVQRLFTADVAPELGDAAAFLKSLAAAPPEGTTLTVTAPQAGTLRGLLNAHVPDFQAVLAVVESPAVQALLDLARALL